MYICVCSSISHCSIWGIHQADSVLTETACLLANDLGFGIILCWQMMKGKRVAKRVRRCTRGRGKSSGEGEGETTLTLCIDCRILLFLWSKLAPQGSYVLKGFVAVKTDNFTDRTSLVSCCFEPHQDSEEIAQVITGSVIGNLLSIQLGPRLQPQQLWWGMGEKCLLEILNSPFKSLERITINRNWPNSMQLWL